MGHNNILKKKIGENLNYSYRFGKINANLKKLLNISRNEKLEYYKNNTQSPARNNINNTNFNIKIKLTKKNDFNINKVRLINLFNPINKNICLNPNSSREKRKMEDLGNKKCFQKAIENLFKKYKKISVNKNNFLYNYCVYLNTSKIKL